MIIIISAMSLGPPLQSSWLFGMGEARKNWTMKPLEGILADKIVFLQQSRVIITTHWTTYSIKYVVCPEESGRKKKHSGQYGLRPCNWVTKNTPWVDFNRSSPITTQVASLYCRIKRGYVDHSWPNMMNARNVAERRGTEQLLTPADMVISPLWMGLSDGDYPLSWHTSDRRKKQAQQKATSGTESNIRLPGDIPEES